MITSRTSDKHRGEAARAGVDVYLTKPYQDADLLLQVRSLCSKLPQAEIAWSGVADGSGDWPTSHPAAVAAGLLGDNLRTLW